MSKSANRLRSKLISTSVVTPVISTGIYTTADAVGGLMTFINSADKIVGSGTIKGVVLIDNDSEEDVMELHLYNQTITATADKDAIAVTDADLANYVGRIDIAAADYAAFAANSVAHVAVDLPFNLVAGGTSLFGQSVVRGAPTYTAVTDIVVKLVIVQD